MSSGRRKPGSELGRPAIDWEPAFAYYAQLPPEQRSYRAVADQFGVSVRTVERHGREEHWQLRLSEIEAEVIANMNAAIVEARSEQRTNTVKLIQATLIGYAEKLRRGEIRMTPGDLEKLYRLFLQLETELDSQPSTVDTPNTTTPLPSGEHLIAVIEALAQTGALEQLGLQRIPPAADESESEVASQ
jgi:hypothetical protein